MPTPLPVSPTIATIDQNNFLVINWNPPVFIGGYVQYKDWNIFLGTPPSNFPGILQLINGIKPTGLEFPGSSVDSRIFQEQLIQADYGLNMQAEPVDGATYSNSPKFSNADQLFAFPSSLQTLDVILDNATVELGQTITVTLANTYPETAAGAQFWQVFWPDNTTTGPLPLSNRSAAKSFSSPGSLSIIVKTWNDYSAFNPPVKLYRQLAIPIFVVDQQFNAQAAVSDSLTGTLGFGGSQGFEIVDATTTNVTPQPYSVITRCLARDTTTNELKLLAMTSRFPNASSELGTMALDVFPLEGRPHAKELIVPDQVSRVTPQTSSIPVKITTSILPNVIVGKPMPQFKLQATGGIEPYGWANDGTLPDGLFISVDGTLTGTSTQLGTFSVNFSAIDGGSPAYIANITLPLTVQTDLVINTPSIGNATVLTPYNQQLVSSGGLAPYTWEIAAGALPLGISIDPTTGLLHGIPCTYNSTTDFNPGTTFTATIQITDAIGAKAAKTYSIHLLPAPLQFALQADQIRIFSAQDFVLAVPIFGGKSPYNTLTYLDDGAPFPTATHTLVDGRAEIELDIPTIQTGNHSFALGITDSLSTTVAATFTYTVGQRISDIRMQNAFFSHYWSNTVNISNVQITSNVLTITANNVFAIGSQVVFLGLGAATFLNSQQVTITGHIGSGPVYTGFTSAFTHANYGPVAETLGTAGDTTKATISILGNLAGFTLNPVTVTPVANGLGISVNPTLSDVEVVGPATTFRNAENRIPLQVFQGANQVAQISRPYTFVTHDDRVLPGEIGNIQTLTRTYIVGEFVGLNPRKPYWNSPDTMVIPSFTPTPASVALTVRVQSASSLPTGLSLDANTGLIYGNLLAVATSTSVLEYVDALGLVHGTVTVTWSTLASDFQLIDNSVLNDLQTGNVYSLNVFTAPTGVVLTSASLFTGNLPNGLASVTTDGSHVILSGIPIEAGYFDAWFLASTGVHNSYIHARVSVDYIAPLTILTTSLPAISAQPYTTQLQGFGGIPPYTSWTSPQFPAGSGVGNFLGLSLITNADGTGTISGTLTSPPVTSPTDLGNVSLSLTDTRGSGSAVSAILDFSYNNTLRISTPLNGIPTIDSSGPDFSFAMHAAGGVPPYSWNMASSPALPTGIVFSSVSPAAFSVEPTGGKFSGSTTVFPYSNTVNITVKDSALTTATGAFLITTGPQKIAINDSGAGAIPRGQSYQGRLKVVAGINTPVAPVTWQVSPTPSHPNLLPSGLTLAPDATSNGIQAVISGIYTGAALVGYVVRVVAVDSSGNTAVDLLNLNTVANSVSVTTTSLPNATIGGSYNTSLQAAGGVPPYVWVVDPSTPGFINSSIIPTLGGAPTGLTLASSGVITGSATLLFTNSVFFKVTDTLSNVSVPTSLTLSSQAAGLAITTTQTNLNANQPVSGRNYSFAFTAGGDPNTPYIWSISPISANQLPTGLALSSTGVVSGNTILTGFSKTITLRVTDAIGAFVDGAFLFTVAQGLTLKTGIDYEDSISTGILGFIDAGSPDSILPRPNLSFYAVATGVTSTSSATMSAGTNNANVVATIESVSGGVAKIKLSDVSGTSGFVAGIIGVNSIVVSVIDSGVSINATFTWTVYDNGVLRLAPSSGSLPIQLTSGS